MRFLLLAVAAIVLPALAAPVRGDDPLPSWNDGPAKKTVTDFVTRVTQEGSPDHVVPAERIALFDNDGTLWCEQPMYFRLLFALDRVQALSSALDKALDEAGQRAWTVVDMKRDWKTVFPAAPAKSTR